MRRDGLTDMMKLTVVFRQLANASKSDLQYKLKKTVYLSKTEGHDNASSCVSSQQKVLSQRH